MTEKIKRTLDLKNEILSFYSTSENDKKIVDALCFATNTLPIVESAFYKCVDERTNIECFYKEVLCGFIKKNTFPLCCETIVELYPSLFDYALETALPRVVTEYVCKTAPYLDAGIINIPFDSEWGDFINLSYIDSSEHNNNYVVSQLLEKLEQVNYEITGDCVLVTGTNKRTIHEGLYGFFYGKNWLVREDYKK